MSYDLMVFNIKAAPKTETAFMKWYAEQAEWSEAHSYDDPGNSSAALRNWFMEMIEVFPAMNGPFATEEADDDPNCADYTIGKDVIYVAFSWSQAEQGYMRMFSLAEKHHLGFFDPSSSDGEALFPIDGKLQFISKPWWKFW